MNRRIPYKEYDPIGQGDYLSMLNIREMAGEILDIHIEQIEIHGSFLDFASRFAYMPGTVLLMSGGDLDCARYHILGIKPWLTFTGRGHAMRINIDEQTIQCDADPFHILRILIKTFTFEIPDNSLPITSGLLGYLAYDLKDLLEDLPHTSIDDLYLPHICFVAPSVIVIKDKQKNRAWLCIPNRFVKGNNLKDNDYSWFQKVLDSRPNIPGPFHGDPIGFQSNFTESDYRAAIEKIREYILQGHVYQVNMSQRFQMDFKGDAFNLFRTLFKNNPAPFFSYLNTGDHQIVSTSPERFLKQAGSYIETRPIKGTKPRGKNESEDHDYKHELEQSDKDDAELSMIVDLLRNDLGKVCQAGSVHVAQHKKIEAYENVYHLVSIIEGVLDKRHDSIDLIKAAFPGGSITGCPKIRAMEIIDELESNRRHIYTGSIGYLSFHETMDLSIAIRTATIYNGKVIFSVGGGIVYDSDPMDEYYETLHKGKTLMDVFRGNIKKESNTRKAWVNGNIQPLEQAFVKVTDLGFQYGYGFFETIRVNHGVIGYLDAHITRFNKAWEQLFNRGLPDLTWSEIIHQLIKENGLENMIAAIKVIATWGSRDAPPFDHGIIFLARPYTHRLEGISEPGLKLVTYPHARQTPLADHKTLNYLYYYLAGEWAKDQDCDEALILNPDGSISETNSANILLFTGKKVIRPASPHVLPGIMENEVCEQLKTSGFSIEEKKMFPKDLFMADGVLLTNSLMGAVPVLTVDGNAVKSSSDLYRKINEKVL
ncbi:aminodeoxychorismate synthase component I [Thermodesulfobacteriota bacterium]